jgi:hypothetical protein
VNVPFAIIGAVRPNSRRVIWYALVAATSVVCVFVMFLFMLSIRESRGGGYARFERDLGKASR